MSLTALRFTIAASDTNLSLMDSHKRDCEFYYWGCVKNIKTTKYMMLATSMKFLFFAVVVTIITFINK